MFDWSLFTSLPTLIIVGLISIYLYATRNFNYWKSRGVNGPKPVPFIGNINQVFSKPMCVYAQLNYNKYGKIYGLYEGSQPVLTVGEPELIKDITIRDFHKFVDRGHMSFGDPIFDRSMLLAIGDDWKIVRTLVSPTFSSGKMRKMQPLIEDCVRNLEKVLYKFANDQNSEMNVKQVMVNYTMDVISSCAFATRINAHNDPNNPFVKSASAFFRPSLRLFLFFLLNAWMPSVVKKFHFCFASQDIIDYFKSALRAIINRRETEKVSQIDFLQLMLDARDNTSSKDVDEDIEKDIEKIQKFNKKRDYKIEEIDILATSLLFLLAGYETTASTLSFLLHELSLNTECQQKLYKEIMSYDGKADYDSIAKMTYLDACVSETLRMYSPLVMTSRIASQDYNLGDTGLEIPKGMMIQIPIYAIHHSEEYYPNPNQFNPERFMPENKDKLIAGTYLPFGSGPRNCVGMRFALMNVKTAIVNIVSKFRFISTENTKTQFEYKKFVVFTQALDMGTIKVEKRSDN